MACNRLLCFAAWAAEQEIDPLCPTAVQIASFLFSLFKTHGLAPQTVKGYRSGLASVLSCTGKVESNYRRHDNLDGARKTQTYSSSTRIWVLSGYCPGGLGQTFSTSSIKWSSSCLWPRLVDIVNFMLW